MDRHDRDTIALLQLVSPTGGVFLPMSQAREAILQENQATEARRAARARQLAMNPPQVYKMDWDSSEPFPHRCGM